MVSLSIQSLISSDFKIFSAAGQKASGTGNASARGRPGELSDHIQLSTEAREKLAELTDTSKELSALSKRVRDSAESHEAATRAAKRDKIKQQIEQLKMQLLLASASDAKALVKKLKALASELKQLGSDAASAGGSAIPTAAASAATVEETGTRLVNALGGTQAVAATTSSAGLPGDPSPADAAASALDTSSAGEGGEPLPANGSQSARQDGERTDREKLADAYRQIYDTRQNDAVVGNSRKEELAAIKELARDLKLLAGQIERKLKDEDDEDRDLKTAKRDIQETLNTDADPSNGPIEATPAGTSVASGSQNVRSIGPDVASANIGLAGVKVPIVQVQTYINVQISVGEV